MKKTLTIIIGSVVILLVTGIWVYLLLFDTPESREKIFANLGINTPEQRTTITEPDLVEENTKTLVDTAGEALRQLTTRPVAGFVPLERNSIPFIRYAETGTGHIYEINLSTGEEDRLSGTTLTRVSDATFSNNGQYVALTSINGYDRDVLVGEIVASTEGTGRLEGSNLPPQADNVILATTTAYYTLNDTLGTIGYILDLETNNQEIDFIIPLNSIKTISSEGQIYFYNRFSSLFEGAIFYETDNRLTPLTRPYFGFLAMLNKHYIVHTQNTEVDYQTISINRDTNTETVMPANLLPEKCQFDDKNTSVIWCAADFKYNTSEFVENWYKGVTKSKDALWEIDLNNGDAIIHDSFSETAGRDIDVAKLAQKESRIFFTNKNDGTLWLYDLSQ